MNIIADLNDRIMHFLIYWGVQKEISSVMLTSEFLLEEYFGNYVPQMAENICIQRFHIFLEFILIYLKGRVRACERVRESMLLFSDFIPDPDVCSNLPPLLCAN